MTNEELGEAILGGAGAGGGGVALWKRRKTKHRATAEAIVTRHFPKLNGARREHEIKNLLRRKLK